MNSCPWCGAAISGSRFCGGPCRFAHHHFARHRGALASAPELPPLALAYANALDAELEGVVRKLRNFDGWAVSVRPSRLAHFLSLLEAAGEADACVRVASWHRGNGWEAVVYLPARPKSQPVADVLYYVPRPWGESRKPPAFVFWLFLLVGANRADSVEELVGSERDVERAWQIFTTTQGVRS